MKKTTLLVAALAFGATTAFAQDLTSKKGEPFLPEAGDWAVGFDATPFLQYFGNLANGTSGNGLGGSNPLGWTNPYGMITGKYFASETMAYRGMLRIGFNSNSYTNPQVDNTSTATPPAMVDDKLKMSNHFIGLGAGVEMRRGKTRLQGYYGGQFMFWLSGAKDTYTYGNAFSSTVPNPNTTDWSGTTGYNNINGGARTTEMKYGSGFGVGVRGFVGVEYFILPKISLGAEYGWGIGFQSTGAGETTFESWNGSSTTSTTVDTGKSSKMMVDTDNNAMGIGGSGQILVHFHF